MEKEFIQGIYLSYQNAKNLNEEAQILENNRKISRAYTLYHLSLEECGRFHIVYNCFSEYIRGEIKGKDFNYGTLKKRGYEHHQLKIEENFDGIFRITYITLAISKNLKNPDDFEKIYKTELDNLAKTYNATLSIKDELNSLKNKSLYVTYNDNKFILPENSISESDFFRIKQLTSLSLQAMEKIVEFFEAKGGFEKMRENLRNGS